jgi:DNA-binding beta-propeller fold protein YncE
LRLWQHLDHPAGISIGGRDTLYVATADGTIRRFGARSSGAQLTGLAAGLSGGRTQIAVDSQGTVWEVIGGDLERLSSSGQFLPPFLKWPAYAEDVAFDRSGNVYLADAGTHRVGEFSSTGLLLTRFGGPQRPSENAPPQAVAVDGHSNVYVLNGRGQILHFSPAGRLLGIWSGYPLLVERANSPARGPVSIGVSGNGNLYLADGAGDRIESVSPDGAVTAVWGSQGSAPGLLSLPYGLALDRSGNVYVADSGNSRIQKFSATGKLLAVWDLADVLGDGLNVSPTGIAIDALGNAYVADATHDMVLKLSPSGQLTDHWGSRGSAPGRFRVPSAVAVDLRGNLYVVDSGNNRVQILTSRGNLLDIVGSPGKTAGSFERPSSIAVDSHGDFYVVDNGNARIQKFSQ